MSTLNKDQLLFSGSVKNIYINPQDQEELIFEYSDRYSVFDWGEMPDLIHRKGEALAVMTDLIFKEFENPNSWKHLKEIESKDSQQLDSLMKSDEMNALQAQGARTHRLALVNSDGMSLKEGERSRYFKVQRVQRHLPDFKDGSWNYDVYQQKPTRCLVPLEVIFRFGTPKGSSLIKRIQKEPNWLKELSLEDVPKEGDFFPWPVIEFSTKLEPQDRYLSRSHALEMAAMSERELSRLINLTTCYALKLKEIFLELGLTLWDGKFEFAFGEKDQEGNREFTLIDSIGPDELRLTRNGKGLSKEVLRQAYEGTEWKEIVEACKEEAKREGGREWKQMVVEKGHSAPPKLDDEILNSVSSLYTTMANQLAKRQGVESIFP